MTVLDYIIISGVFIWLIAAVYYIIRQKKSGGSVCCGSCAGCGKHCQPSGVKRNK